MGLKIAKPFLKLSRQSVWFKCLCILFCFLGSFTGFILHRHFSMPTYNIIYFHASQKIDLIHLIFTEANVQYENIYVDYAEWTKIPSKMLFGQFPILNVDGVLIPPPNVIVKFLAEEFYLDGKINFEVALCDPYVAFADDLVKQMRPWFMKKGTHKKEKLWYKFEEDHMIHLLAIYENFLKDNGIESFVGNHLTCADLYILKVLQTLQARRNTTILDPYPHLQNIVDFIGHRPEIKAWIEKRSHTEF